VGKKTEQMMPPLQHATKSILRPQSFCLSFSSWFCVPDQGMKDFEILCRASAFLIKAKVSEALVQYELLMLFKL
jgi:hypothetical protein